MVGAGRSVIPAIGAPLLAVGGLVATLAALNTNVFSASRLSFPMGRDRMVPPAPLFVNAALLRWRVLHPEVRRGFTAPLFPVFPALAIGANLVLIVFLATQPGVGTVAWTVIALWVGLGVLPPH